ncbi:hypothetical protein MNB_SV-12-1181 [hydrothermal vent metagenome]|uniref:TIGR02646 family protein n=1 Tax=hydrothermal vent metagenome TaxID=652676 RepID=A0A1W1C5N6_9ZZZZ
MREHLLEEQGYICCYCMSRIDASYMKIEHFKARSLFREKQLNYANLFGACCGKKIDKNQFYNCDKGKKNLDYIDLLSNIERSIKYKKDGTILSDNSDIDKELNKILNLNHEDLKNNREDALNQLTCELKKRKNGFETSNLKRIIRQYQNKNSKGKYRPYCEMIVYFLTKKLKSKGIVLK